MTYQLINESELRANFEGDEEILKELIEEFIVKHEAILTNLEKAIQEKNLDNIKLHAHTLKGVVSNFFAESLRQQLYEIENNAHKKMLINYEELLKNVLENLKKLIEELIQLGKSL